MVTSSSKGLWGPRGEPWGLGKYEMGGVMVLAPYYSSVIALAPPKLKLPRRPLPATPLDQAGTAGAFGSGLSPSSLLCGLRKLQHLLWASRLVSCPEDPANHQTTRHGPCPSSPRGPTAFTPETCDYPMGRSRGPHPAPAPSPPPSQPDTEAADTGSRGCPVL